MKNLLVINDVVIVDIIFEGLMAMTRIYHNLPTVKYFQWNGWNFIHSVTSMDVGIMVDKREIADNYHNE